jgi:hypothetical protein
MKKGSSFALEMIALRHTAMVLFGMLLVGCVGLELAEVCFALEGERTIMAFDLESEESEEGQEEEREGQNEKKDKTSEYEAFLNGDRIRLALDSQRLHRVVPGNVWTVLVDAKIWEPPELG